MNLPPTLDPDEIAAVAKLLAKAVREEREACARIAEAMARAYHSICANAVAARIRERNEQ